VTVILRPFLENDLPHPPTYFAVDVLSLSNEHILATNAERDADITRKQTTINCSSLLGSDELSAYRVTDPLVSVVEGYGYADTFRRLVALSRNFSQGSAQRAGRLNDEARTGA
jgi:hypothetical protein